MLIGRKEVEKFLKRYEDLPSFSVSDFYYDYKEVKTGKRPHGKVPGASHKHISSIFQQLVNEELLEIKQERYNLTPTYIRKWKKPKSDVEILKKKERKKYPEINFENLLWKDRIGILLVILRNLWDMKKIDLSSEAVYKYLVKISKNNVFKLNEQRFFIIFGNNVKVSIKDFLDQLSFIKVIEKIKENTYRLTPKIFERFNFSITKEYKKEKEIQFDTGIFLGSFLFLVITYGLTLLFPYITPTRNILRVMYEFMLLLFIIWFLFFFTIILSVRRKKIFDYYIWKSVV